MILIHRSIPFQVTNLIKVKTGRYLIVQGTLLTEKNNLVNIYAPNNDDPRFFKDLNCLLEPTKDQSSGIDKSHIKSREVILNFMNELNLKDIWRELKPCAVEYSCYFSTHQSHPCIEYVFNISKFGLKMKDCNDNGILI